MGVRSDTRPEWGIALADVVVPGPAFQGDGIAAWLAERPVEA